MHPQEIIEVCHRSELPSPCYVIHLGRLEENLRILRSVQDRAKCHILLALKGFAAFAVFPRIRAVLRGTTASSVHEARLGTEEFGGEVHAYFVAYRTEEVEWLVQAATHITFNSLSQWYRYRPIVRASTSAVSCGLRINPEYSEIKTELYNPCRPGSRFGITADQLQDADWTGIEGLHFHTMCEQNSDTLERTLEIIENKFGPWLRHMRWLNMGGGHHITRPDYDIDRLCRCAQRMQDKYGLQVYLEPGEAIALNTGYLVTTVLDRFRSGDRELAILDTSATAHMPDVLEMPYRPEVIGGYAPGQRPNTITLGGLTCLAGDVIGEWSFDRPLEVGDRLIFTDMAHYTMVKNTTFNGIPLPSIAVYDPQADAIRVVRQFGYEDYRNRLS